MSQVAGLTRRCLEIQMGNTTQTHKVTQYHYTNWPDFGVPDTPKPLVDLVNKVRRDLSPGDVCLVHCSAGVGRTGTMIALKHIMDEIDSQEDAINIFDTVLQLRSQRVLMVQKPSQYQFLYACTDTYLKMLDGTANEGMESYYVYGNFADEDYSGDEN